MTACRAMAVIQDNGERVEVELPTEQDLLDQIFELTRDAETEIDRWKSRHAACGKALTASAVLNAAVAIYFLVRWLA
jgi:hypothetical protein